MVTGPAKLGMPQPRQDAPADPGVMSQRRQNVPAHPLMGILTEDEIRNTEFYTEFYRCKNQALERELMQIQAAIHEVTDARRLTQDAMHSIASENSLLVQMLSQLKLQDGENIEATDPKDLQLPVQAQQTNGEELTSQSSCQKCRNRKRPQKQGTSVDNQTS